MNENGTVLYVLCFMKINVCLTLITLFYLLTHDL